MTGKEVAKVRKLLGLDQGRFARVFGMSRATICFYESEGDTHVPYGPAVMAFVAVHDVLRSATGVQIAAAQDSLKQHLEKSKGGTKDSELLNVLLKVLRE